MSGTHAVVDAPGTFLPVDDAQVAKVYDFGAALKARRGVTPEVTPTLSAPDGTHVELPWPVFEALLKVVEAMRQGLAVTVAPINIQLTTQEAADLLGVSRPTVVKLCEQGEIRYTKPGRHRRVLLSEVLAYQARQQGIRAEALARIAEAGEDLELYEVDPDEYRGALKKIRKHRATDLD
jgi:excisionase family DNA binding protein